MANNTRTTEQRITTPSQLGELLSRRRKSRRLPQRELAAKLGVSQGRFSDLEGDPSRLTLERLIQLSRLLDLELILRERSEAKPSGEW